MKRLIITMTVIAATLSGMAVQYSKLGIITAAKAAGKWPALKAWIAASGYEDEWLVANYLSDDFPQFAEIVGAIVAAGVATEEEAAAILAASHDTALPDALMVSRYRRDMASASGRRDWHGPCSTAIDTNRLVRVYTYEDGYYYEEPWSAPKPKIQVDLERARQVAQKLNARAENLPSDAAAALRARAAAILANAEAVASNGVQTVTVEIGPGGTGVEPTPEGETAIDNAEPSQEGEYAIEPAEESI